MTHPTKLRKLRYACPTRLRKLRLAGTPEKGTPG
jgi:hypothetical protein